MLYPTVTLLLLELALRLWIANPSAETPHPVYGTVSLAGSRIVHSSEGYGIHELDSHGWFDEELPSVLPGPLALLLGDTYAESRHVSRQESFAALAEIDGWTVLNAGYSNRSPRQYAAFVQEWAERLEPRVIVVQVYDGDVDKLLADAARAVSSGGDQNLAAVTRQRESETMALLRKAMHRSALVTTVFRRGRLLLRLERERWSQRFTEAPETAPPRLEIRGFPGETKAATELDRALQAIRRHCPEVILLYIPELEYHRTPTVPMRASHREFFRDAAERNGCGWLDPTQTLIADYVRTEQPLHGFQNSVMGRGHLNRRGHAVVGEMLATTLGDRSTPESAP